MPLLLDLFCGAGGAGVGYQRAGFEVVGVDITLQKHYPFEFHQADALEFLAKYGGDFDAIHASPPCQAYSTLRSLHKKDRADLVAPTRLGLEASGRPWVIENVVGAPLRNPMILCGSMFGLGTVCRDGVNRQLRRHRLFESTFDLRAPGPCVHVGQPVGVYGHGGGGQMTRGYKGDKADSLGAMGVDWMNRAEVSQAIPPTYTEYIGKQLLAYLQEGSAAA